MAQHFRLSEADCLEIAGTQHRLVRSDKAGSIWARLDEDEIHLEFTTEELLRCLAGPDTRLKRGHFSDKAALRRLRCDVSYLNTCDAEARARALYREAWAKAFLQAEAAGELRRSNRSINRVFDLLEQRVTAAEERGQDVGRTPRAGQSLVRRRRPCAKTLLRWVREYEAAGCTPLVFLRRRKLDLLGGKLMGESEAVLAECVASYLDRNQPTQQDVVNEVEERFSAINAARREAGKPPLPQPSARTVRRRIKALDPFEVEAQRKGLESARRKFGFYEEGLRADYPLQRVEMDEWLIDIASMFGESGALDSLPPEARAMLEVGRRWIYVALDCATRCVLGFRIVAAPNTEDAIRTLHLITQDKTALAEAAGCHSRWDQAGGLDILVTDQGSAFAAELFRMAVVDLGCTYEAPPAGVPKLRARIERLFRTFGQQLAPMLIGRTFGNSVERGDYPSEKWAALTDDELAQIFTLFIVDIYHNTPHSGLKGETPANAWKRLSAEQGVTPPPDANTRRAVFGLPHTRKLDRHGVRVCGINYTCPALQDAFLRGLSGEISLRLDPEDLTHISACIGHEWVSAQAVPRAVWGLSLDEWQSIVQELRTRFKSEAVLSEEIIRKARKRIRAIDARARQLRRVQPTKVADGALLRAEKQLFLGLRIGPDKTAATGDLDQPKGRKRPGPDDLLGDVIQSNTPVGPAPTGSAATPSTTDEEWDFND